MSNLIDILNKLLSSESVSPSDGGLVEYIANLLSTNSFNIITKEYNINGIKTKNLYAYKGTEGKNFVFSGHLDVVPAGNLDSWKSPPFSYTEHDNKIYGRGAIDMKSSIACMISSLINYKGDGKVALLVTSDEEIGGEAGMKPFLEDITKEGHKLDYVIVGEPTSSQKFGDIIKNGRRGSINFQLEIKGVQGHVAYPDNAKNPINIAANLINKLNNVELDKGNEYFQKSNLEFTSIDVGNNTDNIIPESVKILFNIRYNNINTREEIGQFVNGIIEEYCDDYHITSTSSSIPFINEDNKYSKFLQDIIENETGTRPNLSTSGGTSDARYLSKYGKILEFGPVNQYAHKIDEHIEISDLQKLFNVYYSAINSFHKIIK